jgi:hypothetical protein
VAGTTGNEIEGLRQAIDLRQPAVRFLLQYRVDDRSLALRGHGIRDDAWAARAVRARILDA